MTVKQDLFVCVFSCNTVTTKKEITDLKMTLRLMLNLRTNKITTGKLAVC